MIGPYALHKYLKDHLAARGFAFDVEYERRFKDAPRKNFVVIGRDRNTIEPYNSVPTSKGSTEPRRAVRMLPCMALVYASAPVNGAHHGDHETLCYETVDAMCVGIQDWAQSAHVELVLNGGRLLRADELDFAPTANAGTVWTGVVHLTQFQVGHGVFDRDASGKPVGRYATIRHTQLKSVTTHEGEPAPEPVE